MDAHHIKAPAIVRPGLSTAVIDGHPAAVARASIEDRATLLAYRIRANRRELARARTGAGRIGKGKPAADFIAHCARLHGATEAEQAERVFLEAVLQTLTSPLNRKASEDAAAYRAAIANDEEEAYMARLDGERARRAAGEGGTRHD